MSGQLQPRLPQGFCLDDTELVEVSLVTSAGTVNEEVHVDPDRGPLVYQHNGSLDFFVLRPIPGGKFDCYMGAKYDYTRRYIPKRWSEMSSTEQSVMLQMAAKKNRQLRAWKGDDFWGFAGTAIQEVKRQTPEEEMAAKAEEEALAGIVQQKLEGRCAQERARAPTWWTPITIDTVNAGHETKGPGMIYGLEFPWTEQMLAEFGPAWLTAAFHAAGTLDRDNRVMSIKLENKIKVTTGNNGGKFLFEVEYLKTTPELHTHLFAKIPFPLTGATKSDRLSSSVNKQPQELWEINTYRLLEAALPVKTPRFYYGDISNQTSNWILITERVMFADHDGMNFGMPPRQRRKPLRPYQIEGPYDKCIDYNLRGPEKEYYLLLVQTGAKMAGLYKANKFGSGESLMANFGRPLADISSMEAWGVNPAAATGEDPDILVKKLETAMRFISDTGQVLFPEYVKEDYFQAKLANTLLTLSAYSAEIAFWKHHDPDYTALAHTNLNVDNAYFWRDKDGKLELGVFDWGAMGAGNLGHKLWWWLYCGDFGPFRNNLTSYLEAFADTYREYGGPTLDLSSLKTTVLITAMEQMLGLVAAVPQIMKMCPAKEWPSIRNRYDPRISENVDGKSTLRLYLHVMNSIIRIIEEMKGDKVLQEWIQQVWAMQLRQKAKSVRAWNST